MARVELEPDGERRFRVTVSEGGSRSVHQVTIPAGYVDRLTAGRMTEADLVRLSFTFLLEREPKESILTSFDLPVISRYFPEFEREVKRRVDGGA